jgi:hypothetical protein
MATSDNLGMRAVQQIHQLWNADENWTLWDQRGFSWWAQDYRQHVWAEPPVNDNGFSVYKLCARTDFICNIEADTVPLYEKLSVLGQFASTSAPVLDMSEKTLRLWTIVYFHEETADLWVS